MNEIFVTLWQEFLDTYGTSKLTGGYSYCAWCFAELDPAVTCSLHKPYCLIGRVQAELLKIGALKGQLRLALPKK